jgi:hypothetical protein
VTPAERSAATEPLPKPELALAPGYDIDLEPPATAADWLEPGPEDRHPYGFEPRIYVTEISVPSFGDGVQRLHSRMREPEPLPELEAEPEPEAEL